MMPPQGPQGPTVDLSKLPKPIERVLNVYDVLSLESKGVDPKDYVKIEVPATMAGMGPTREGPAMVDARVIFPKGTFRAEPGIIQLTEEHQAHKFGKSVQMVSLPVVSLVVRRDSLHPDATTPMPDLTPAPTTADSAGTSQLPHGSESDPS